MRVAAKRPLLVKLDDGVKVEKEESAKKYFDIERKIMETIEQSRERVETGGAADSSSSSSPDGADPSQPEMPGSKHVPSYYGDYTFAGNTHLVTDLIDGPSLSSVLSSSSLQTLLSAPTVTSAVDSLAHQLLSALTFLSAASIVHRDIKPDNVLISPEGTVKVVDFGSAACMRKPKSKLSTMLRNARGLKSGDAPAGENITNLRRSFDLFACLFAIFSCFSASLLLLCFSCLSF